MELASILVILPKSYSFVRVFWANADNVPIAIIAIIAIVSINLFILLCFLICYSIGCPLCAYSVFIVFSAAVLAL